MLEYKRDTLQMYENIEQYQESDDCDDCALCNNDTVFKAVNECLKCYMTMYAVWHNCDTWTSVLRNSSVYRTLI